MCKNIAISGVYKYLNLYSVSIDNWHGNCNKQQCVKFQNITILQVLRVRTKSENRR